MSSTPADPLSPDEKALKLQCERAIHAGLSTFIEVGEALQTIRDRRLYREDYRTFADYCRVMWAMSEGRARQLRRAAQVVQTLANATPGGTDVPLLLPENEAQARALGEFDEDLRPAILRIAARTAETLEKPLSAPLIRRVGEPIQLAARTGAVDVGDGESTVLTAAMTQEMHEAAARQSEHIRANGNRVRLAGQVIYVGDDTARVVLYLDQARADELRVGQLVTVVFTPAVEASDAA